MADGSGYRWYQEPTMKGAQYVQVRLPEDVVCDQCVFRWRWYCGMYTAYLSHSFPGKPEIGIIVWLNESLVLSIVTFSVIVQPADQDKYTIGITNYQ